MGKLMLIYNSDILNNHLLLYLRFLVDITLAFYILIFFRTIGPQAKRS